MNVLEIYDDLKRYAEFYALIGIERPEKEAEALDLMRWEAEGGFVPMVEL
jgi:hypothetical protein